MWRDLARALAILVSMSLGSLAQQTSAKAKFYERLRSNATGPIDNVGIRFWFEDARAIPFTANQAADIGGRFTLHIRNNVGHGFLTVWSIGEKGGVEMTPREGRYAGFMMGKQEYVVPGEFQFKTGATAKRVIIVFSRSQTEQASDPASAEERLAEILRWTGRNGRQVISESDESTPEQVGRYVLNQDGAAVATEIVVR